MKIGLILECAPDGPDEKVLRCLLGKFAPVIECQTKPLGNKQNLVRDCGNAAKLLVEDGCHRVVIVWDLYPANWGDALSQKNRTPCLHEDRERIHTSLQAAGVSRHQVSLVAITYELETWLLSDKRAIADFLSKSLKTVVTVQQAGNHKALRVRDPKIALGDVFDRKKHDYYQDNVHAIKIAQEIRDLSRLNKCPSFKRFWEKATGPQAPPLRSPNLAVTETHLD